MNIELYEGKDMYPVMREIISNRLYLRGCGGDGIRSLCMYHLSGWGDKDQVILLAIARTDDGTPVGCALINTIGCEKDFFQVYVKPCQRRRGLARALLDSICSRKGVSYHGFQYYIGTRASKAFRNHIFPTARSVN